MNDYEGLFIMNPDLKEEGLKEAFKSICDCITKNGGSIKKEEDWGKRQLAYSIKRFKEGHYYKVNFACPPGAISKLESTYRLNADILRTMITRR